MLAILAAVEGARRGVGDGDKSPAQSGDQSPHSKRWRARSLECGEFSPLLPQADWSACLGASSAPALPQAAMPDATANLWMHGP